MGLKSSYGRWQDNLFLSRKQAMEAQCYACNGESAELTNDCLGQDTCPLYIWSPWGKNKLRTHIKAYNQNS